MTTDTKTIDPTKLRSATRLVHGGTLRSHHGETAEALFLTSGFVYDSAEQAEATFAGTIPMVPPRRFSGPRDLSGRIAAR